MPFFYLRRLTGKERSEVGNRHLARYLAFVAGAANAGGFLAVRQYTSHMSGIVAAMTDNLALGNLSLVFNGLAAVLSFLLGAVVTTVCVRWARANSLESQYALPLALEAALLVCFGITSRAFADGRVLGTIMLLSFTMGLQNAIVTKLSNAVIRTTHLTGMVTDIGIALGRLISPIGRESCQVRASEIDKMRLLASLVVIFFIGGVTGALGFKHVGFFFTFPLAALLLLLAIMPVLDDLRRSDRTRT